jgi:hypothetical protein
VRPAPLLAAAALLLCACERAGTDKGWTYVQRGGSATLQSGGAGARLQMDCRKGVRPVTLTFTGVNARGSGPYQAVLVSDAQTTRAAGQIGPASHGFRIVAVTAADDPVMAAFARTGRMELVHVGRHTAFVAGGAQRLGVERFLAYCRGDAPEAPEDRG